MIAFYRLNVKVKIQINTDKKGPGSKVLRGPERRIIRLGMSFADVSLG